MTRLTKSLFIVLLFSGLLLVAYGQFGVDVRTHQADIERHQNERDEQNRAIDDSASEEEFANAAAAYYMARLDIAVTRHHLLLAEQLRWLFGASGGILLVAGLIILLATWGSRVVPESVEFYRSKIGMWLAVLIALGGAGLITFGGVNTMGQSQRLDNTERARSARISELPADIAEIVEKSAKKPSTTPGLTLEDRMKTLLGGVDSLIEGFGYRSGMVYEDLATAISQILGGVGLLSLAAMLITIPYERKRIAYLRREGTPLSTPAISGA